MGVIRRRGLNRCLTVCVIRGNGDYVDARGCQTLDLILGLFEDDGIFLGAYFFKKISGLVLGIIDTALGTCMSIFLTYCYTMYAFLIITGSYSVQLLNHKIGVCYTIYAFLSITGSYSVQLLNHKIGV